MMSQLEFIFSDYFTTPMKLFHILYHIIMHKMRSIVFCEL